MVTTGWSMFAVASLLLTSVLVTTSTLLDGDLRDLSLLPLDKLLAMRRALTYKDTVPAEAPADNSSDSTLAQALRGHPGRRGASPPRRGGPPPSVWVEEVDVSWKGGGSGGYGVEKGGKGKLQGIFQGTVTVLAFLAFGGYLLCLILNALKEKSAALEMTLLTTVAPATRRRRALQLNSADHGYSVLLSLAEAYAKYNQRCLQDQENS